MSFSESSIAFIILTWNSEDYIDDCLDSVEMLQCAQKDVFVVENGSTDNTRQLLVNRAHRQPNLHLILEGKNLGTTVSRNKALRRIPTSTDYICILDSDTIVNQKAFETMATQLKNDPTIGIIAPRLVGIDGTYQVSGRNLPTLPEKLGKASHLPMLEELALHAETPTAPLIGGLQDVGYLMSACWLMSYRAFITIGLFDENIFYAPEDVDYCARAHEAGLRVVLCHDVEITHVYQRISRQALLSTINASHFAGLAYYFKTHGYALDSRRIYDPEKQCVEKREQIRQHWKEDQDSQSLAYSEERPMKVFFVNPPFKAEHGRFARENRSAAITRSGTLYYPLWLIYAAAVCEDDGFQVSFLDAPAFPYAKQQSLDYIESNGGVATKLFVLDTSTPSIYSDIAFADTLKELYPSAFVMLVGTHPSALPEETLNNAKGVDAVARHEFDFIVRDVARALRDGSDPCEVRGLTYRTKDGSVKSNENYPYITDLDQIPWASKFIKKHLDVHDYFFAASAYPEIQMFTGRGCLARCFFCVYPQTMHGHQYRTRSIDNVIGELSYIDTAFPDVKEIVIEDDTFTINKKRVMDFCQKMEETGLNKRFRWLCNARVNLDYETMAAMKNAGCKLIIPGIESGNQQILNNIHKGTTLEQIRAYVANAKKANLAVHACYMVGNKGETKETMQETLNLALELDTDTAQFYPLLPFPGTEAYAWAKQNGYIHGDYNDYVKEDGTINSLMELPDITGDEMVKFCDDARRTYYMRPSYVLHRLQVGLSDPEDLKRSLKAFGNIKSFLLRK